MTFIVFNFKRHSPGGKANLEDPPPELCLLPQKTQAGPDLLSQATLGHCQPSALRRPSSSVPDGFSAGPSDARQAQGGRRWRHCPSVSSLLPGQREGRGCLGVRFHSTAGAAAKVRVQGEMSSKESEISRS